MLGTVLFFDLLTYRKRIPKILLDLHDGTAAVHPGAAFEMQVQTAKIQIGSTHGADDVIANEALGMDEAI